MPSPIPSSSVSNTKGSVVVSGSSSGCHVSKQPDRVFPVLVSQGFRLKGMSFQMSSCEMPISNPSSNPSPSLSWSIGLVA